MYFSVCTKIHIVPTVYTKLMVRTQNIAMITKADKFLPLVYVILLIPRGNANKVQYKNCFVINENLECMN